MKITEDMLRKYVVLYSKKVQEEDISEIRGIESKVGYIIPAEVSTYDKITIERISHPMEKGYSVSYMRGDSITVLEARINNEGVKIIATAETQLAGFTHVRNDIYENNIQYAQCQKKDILAALVEVFKH
jgi:hypothetical protein